MELSEADKRSLLHMARESIVYGVQHKGRMPVDEALINQAPYNAIVSTFVTLETLPDLALRGCIGSLEASVTLLEDVIEHAYSAAFRDPRFPPVTAEEIMTLKIAISVISPHEELSFNNEAELIELLRPQLDGLIIQSQGRRATFLPSVWQELPEKRDFLTHLKRKALFTENYWNSDFKAFRYTTEYFQE